MEESYTETTRERMKRMHKVLVSYAADLERYGKPLDSGLPDVLRFVAAQLGPMTPGNAKERLTDMLMECAERCGNFPEEVKGIDPRAWDHLLVYSPNDQAKRPA